RCLRRGPGLRGAAVRRRRAVRLHADVAWRYHVRAGAAGGCDPAFGRAALDARVPYLAAAQHAGWGAARRQHQSKESGMNARADWRTTLANLTPGFAARAAQLDESDEFVAANYA